MLFSWDIIFLSRLLHASLLFGHIIIYSHISLHYINICCPSSLVIITCLSRHITHAAHFSSLSFSSFRLSVFHTLFSHYVITTLFILLQSFFIVIIVIHLLPHTYYLPACFFHYWLSHMLSSSFHYSSYCFRHIIFQLLPSFHICRLFLLFLRFTYLHYSLRYLHWYFHCFFFIRHIFINCLHYIHYFLLSSGHIFVFIFPALFIVFHSSHFIVTTFPPFILASSVFTTCRIPPSPPYHWYFHFEITYSSVRPQSCLLLRYSHGLLHSLLHIGPYSPHESSHSFHFSTAHFSSVIVHYTFSYTVLLFFSFVSPIFSSVCYYLFSSWYSSVHFLHIPLSFFARLSSVVCGYSSSLLSPPASSLSAAIAVFSSHLPPFQISLRYFFHAHISSSAPHSFYALHLLHVIPFRIRCLSVILRHLFHITWPVWWFLLLFLSSSCFMFSLISYRGITPPSYAAHICLSLSYIHYFSLSSLAACYCLFFIALFVFLHCDSHHARHSPLHSVFQR